MQNINALFEIVNSLKIWTIAADIITPIMILIVLIVVFYHQRTQINTLKDQIVSQANILSSQTTLLENFKTAVDVLDLNKIKDFVKIREETITMKKEKEVQEIKAQYEADIEAKNHILESLNDKLSKMASLNEDRKKITTEKSILSKLSLDLMDLQFKSLYVISVFNLYSMTLDFLLMYSALRVPQKFPEAPKVHELRSELSSIKDVIWSIENSIASVFTQEVIFSPTFKMPEQIADFDGNLYATKLFKITDSFTPFIDRAFSDLGVALPNKAT